MYNQKLCINDGVVTEENIEKRLTLIKKAGFDAFFTAYNSNLKEYRIQADKIGIEYLFVHAPFGLVDKMWERGENAEKAVNELLACNRDCHEIGIKLIVVHAYKGFEPNAGPNETGIENFRKVVEDAKSKNISIAFENTEGDEYLAALMDAFANYDNVGFCWDTGHEQCYNYANDMTALYGNRLLCTHINDNLGISRYDGKTFWTDDLHLLPFDGIIDWQSVTERLNDHGYDGVLTFELARKSKPNRHENDFYTKMTDEEYLAQAYIRACRVATLKNTMPVLSFSIKRKDKGAQK